MMLRTSVILVEGTEDKTDPDAVKAIRDIVNAMKGVYESQGLEDLVNSYVCIKNPLFIFGNDNSSFEIKDQYWIGKIASVDGIMQLFVTPPT